jgi:propionyl-CoA synthetase
MSYQDIYRRSLADPEGFWAEAAKGVSWSKSWDKVCDQSREPFVRWFVGAELNSCYNALDRHVEGGRGQQTALIYDSPVTDTLRKYSYEELRDAVAKLAGGLAARGIVKGDRVVIYMPGVPEAVMAMLACARLGAIHSVVFGGFAANELATRIDDAQPKAILSASCGLEPGRIVAYKPLLDHAIELAKHKPQFCAILQRPQAAATLVAGRDLDWSEIVGEPVGCVTVGANDPLYILYTSGTTGQPKGVVRDNGGHAVVLKWTMDHFYNTQPGETYWAASDIGWQVGHSYITYGPLFHGATAVLYEGKPVGTPDAGAFWRVCAEHGVRVLFTAPTALRAIKQQDPDALEMRKYDLSKLDALFLAGERCDPPTAIWVTEKLQRPVIDHWWQTETGWPITARFRDLGLTPAKPGSGGRPSPGYDVQVLDDEGKLLGRGVNGNLVIRLPMPPGCAPTLWRNEDGYRTSYLADFPGWYRTGDAGVIDADGDVSVMGRTDDIINVAGHRLSTGAMEEVLASHAAVAECAVVGAKDSLKGQTPLGLVVLKVGVDTDTATIQKELVALVRERIGPVAAFKEVHVVTRLPKTRSGKILRASIRRIADGEPAAPPPTIDDPVILDEIGGVLGTR